MKFEIGDKVKYTGHIKKLFGCNGIIVRKCRYSNSCRIVKFIDGCTSHVFIGDLKNNEKGQLVFDFYTRLIK